MDRPGEIGSTIVIKGDITAQEDMVISGRLEGSITVTGHVLTVNEGAEILATVRAKAVLISGHVLGALSADERLELRQTAEVEGELEAPVLKVVDGAIFRGKAETSRERKSKLQLAS
jgi:cytoskeletal protein CcmA (bactofilin family)